MTDCLTEIAGPDDLRLLHREHPDRYPFLLQSTARSDAHGRFDILFAFPGKSLELRGDGQIVGPCADCADTFLDALDTWWRQERVAPQRAGTPFLGGWFLFLGYELAAQIEPGLTLRKDAVLPMAFAVRCTTALVYDHEQDRCFVVCETQQCPGRAQLVTDITVLDRTRPAEPVALREVQEQPSHHFTDAVVCAKEHIAAGDIYQANLSRQWSTTVAGNVVASDIYASLCEANPGPFAGMARWGDVEVISSSPERLLCIRDGMASTRPIAGTRPRSDDDVIDHSLSTELISHPKEIAEHVMLVDLERNDLGRICEAGTVEVDEKMVLESYAHVHHIVSNVTGRLRHDVSPGKAIAAVFPGGTITGCPKVRCMEIIAELEEGPRGAYTGSFGYLNVDGSLDLNILIRTMVKNGNTLTFRAGSGIVADSDPQAELDETRAKAEGMLRALQP